MFRYKVKYWDEDDKVERNDSGIAAGPDYSDAVKRIVKFYGRDCIIELTIYELEDVVMEDELKDGI